MTENNDNDPWEKKFLVTSVSGKRRLMHAKQIEAFTNDALNRKIGLFIDKSGNSVAEEVSDIGYLPPSIRRSNNNVNKDSNNSK